MTGLVVSEQVARRFLLGLQGLWPGRRWVGRPGTTAALEALGRLQLDPVSLVARSHDLVLASRVAGYRGDYLSDAVYQDRAFFEYGGHLDVYPIAEYPFWQLHKSRRRHEPRVRQFLTEFAPLVEQVRETVRERGPLAAGDIPNETRVASGRARNAAGLALYNLWLTGELMTHHREGFERVYDLAERLVPDAGQALTETAVRDHAACETLRREGLSSLREWSGVVGYWLYQPVPRKEAAEWMTRLVDGGAAVPVTVEGHKTERFAWKPHAEVLSALARNQIPRDWAPISDDEQTVAFLSPLDNLLSRERLVDLFGFEFIWEIYKPVDKRRWGAYTMPILYEDRLVGRMDPKLDRTTQTLHVQGLWVEEAGLKDDVRFRRALEAGLRDFAQFHGARKLVLPDGMTV